MLWDVDLDVPPGVLMAIVGPNGAGKTTLIKAILGLVQPAAGQVLVYGRPYAEQRRLRRLRAAARERRLGLPDQRARRRADGHATAGSAGSGGRARPSASAALRGARAGRHGRLRRAGRSASSPAASSSASSSPARWPRTPSSTSWTSRSRASTPPPSGRSSSCCRSCARAARRCVVVHHDLQTVPEYFDWVMLLNVRLVASGPVARCSPRRTCGAPTAGGAAFLRAATGCS